MKIVMWCVGVLLIVLANIVLGTHEVPWTTQDLVRFYGISILGHVWMVGAIIYRK